MYYVVLDVYPKTFTIWFTTFTILYRPTMKIPSNNNVRLSSWNWFMCNHKIKAWNNVTTFFMDTHIQVPPFLHTLFSWRPIFKCHHYYIHYSHGDPYSSATLITYIILMETHIQVPSLLHTLFSWRPIFKCHPYYIHYSHGDSYSSAILTTYIILMETHIQVSPLLHTLFSWRLMFKCHHYYIHYSHGDSCSSATLIT